MPHAFQVFDFESEQWLRCVATLPKRLSNFGAVRVADFIYVIGGHTDCSSPVRDRSSGRPSRSFGISTEAFKIEVGIADLVPLNYAFKTQTLI